MARAGSATWEPGRTNQALKISDRVRTGEKSRAAVRLSNLSVLRVNELTTLAIEAPPRASNKPTLELRSGSTYFFSRERPADLQFKTPLVSGAIRGTEFNLAVDDNGRTVVTLLDGIIDLTNEFGATNLVAGEQGIVDPGQPPRKTAVIDAINIIQWSLYYPGILDPAELGLAQAEQNTLGSSLAAYRRGNLLEALKQYPAGRQPATGPERNYYAALQLVVGQVPEAEKGLAANNADDRIGAALRQLIAAVKHQNWTAGHPAELATEWMAESYYRQSRGDLEGALAAARAATARSPEFGFAWVRLAELEFSFGRVPRAVEAVDRGLQLSPENAQALSLKGFLHAARNEMTSALSYFDQAIAIDGALGNAWLGRGLSKIRRGQSADGRADLQTAATLEPNRALLRSYLGKAFSYTRDEDRAGKELDLARKLDPNDPTAWLYSALLNQQRNRVNEAVTDLTQSQELNDNRSIFRSQMLLDQDRAVRSANLAAIYRDAGMTDVSVREASRAVNFDYANYSSHLFLANSYDSIRDPKLFNLRYETPWFTEYLVANLLAPVGGGTLSQNVSQQEYSKLFERDRVGISSSTEYFSSGDWIERASHFGTFHNTSYAIDAYYRSENGQRPNNDYERTFLTAQFKQQLTPTDSVLVLAQYTDIESGDVAQYYDQNRANPTLRVRENQEPNLFAGWHHEWQPGIHTLFLAGWLNDELTLTDRGANPLFVRYAGGVPTRVSPQQFSLAYESELEAYSTDLQQIFTHQNHSLIAGARYQAGGNDTRETLQNLARQTVADQDLETDLERIGLYAYYFWRVLPSLQLTAGVSYDRLEFPENIDTAPISSQERTEEQVSPKAGFYWMPHRDTVVRGAYTRSLGGLFFDTSVRLEPTQIAGFNQAYRSLIPESAAGLVPGTSFETFSLGVDHTFPTRTYVGVEGELLKSDGMRVVGVFTNSTFLPIPDRVSSTRQTLDYEERSMLFTVNQLLSKEWSLGARYKFTQADLDGRFIDIPAGVPRIAGFDQNEESTLHQLWLYLRFHHRCGFFSQLDSVWSQQSNQGYQPDLPGDDFWQFNVFAGYRFLRRAVEVRVGLLNFTDQDYKLNPLTLYSELPRERTFYASLRFYF